MKKGKKLLSLVLSVAVLVSMVGGSFLTAGAIDAEGKTIAKDDSKIYSNFTILGDSICLGFSVNEMSGMDTFEIVSNAENNKYPWSYPSQVTEKLGLSPTDNLRNFGICAAWSVDMKNFVTDPFTTYAYDYSGGFDEDTTFTIPFDIELTKEDTTKKTTKSTKEGAELFDESLIVGDYDKYVDQEGKSRDYWSGTTTTYTYDYVTVFNIELADGTYIGYSEEKNPTYVLKKGTKVKLGTVYNYWGTSYGYVNSILSKYFTYMDRNDFDEDGNIKDNNGDGVKDDLDYMHYYTNYKAVGYDSTSYQTIYEVYDDEGNVLTEDQYCKNPQFIKTYYKYIQDNLENSDLVALAFGGNDIMHTFLPYAQDNPDNNPLITLFYYIAMAMMNGTDITTIMDEDYIEGILNGGGSWWDTEEESLGEGESTGIDLTSILSTENLEGFLEYFSEENMNELYKEVLANYPDNLNSTIEGVQKANPDAQVIAISQYNAFGLTNYLNMIAQGIEDGRTEAHLSNAGDILMTLLEQILEGVEINLEDLQDMDEEAIQEKLAEIEANLAKVDITSLDSDALGELALDIAFPVSCAIFGTAFEDTFDSMNEIIQESCEKYGVTYVDITECPTNGQIDPHPTEEGHTWIADTIYNAIVKNVTATVSGKNGEIALSKDATRVETADDVTKTRLHNDLEYVITPDDNYKISEITIDGTVLDKSDAAYKTGKYTFKDVTEDHTITVSFEKCSHSESYVKTNKAGLNVEGSVQTICSDCNKVLEETAIPAVSEVTLEADEIAYNGKAITPAVTEVKLSDGTVLGAEDYTVEYKDNVNAGTAQAVITYDEDNYDPIVKEFTITPIAQKISVDKTSITKVYRANSIDLGATAKTTLTYKSSDKSVATVNKKTGKLYLRKAGKCTITVTAAAEGNYKKATKKITVTVKPRKSYIDTVKVANDKMTVKMSYTAASRGAKTYQVAYRVKGTDSWKTVTTTKKSVAVKSLKSGKKYEVKVRAYRTLDGKKYYGAWSKVTTTAKIK